MNFETIEGILNINLNSTMTLALAAVLLIMGYSINKRLMQKWVMKMHH